jgi:transposase InsO family protein
MKVYPVTVLCKVMEVSRSGFYDYLCRLKNLKCDDPIKSALNNRIKIIFKESRQSYGSRRVLKKLQSERYQLGRYRVRSLMKKLGLRPRRPRRYKVTTNSKHSFPVVSNILDRKFDVTMPDKVWASDITYVWTSQGWLYLAVVMDLFSRQIVGWASDKHMQSKLTIDALAMAYWRRKPCEGLLHHSDRGSQYACSDYQMHLKQYKMTPSMSRKGDCWDNAPVERFFGSLKTERLESYRFTTRKEAQIAILDYITYYNFDRLHSTLGYQSPMQYEKEQLQKVA